ncbi:uncharacterized protein BDR25DRAFT_283481 [Lindgomyces ingoldianus]|uniref:Uncharacterized protein n=1 Tax=Lindgomyces ingoldianus TaxID=673940 RepID=A0ACB6R0R1_9PLEO|nr:uncharacterized protein BDR25DRAFT_283481 [Lindgomyces ingoldianus]KAF2472894.1 hypothetical protein BDR25DRAFT_283481 [Lindgomyces ingoldianus]
MFNGGHALPTTYPATIMSNLNAAHPSNISKLYNRDLPDSQESFVSASSRTSAAPRLLLSSSNISNATVPDTEFTSPSSSNAPSSQSQLLEPAMLLSPTRARGVNSRPNAPRIETDNAPRTTDKTASPMSIDSPVLAQASKRTASGTVKSAGLTVDSSVAVASGHRRTISVESNSNPRIGELSAQLRTRLSYAMVKVQNGWEKQSLEELEELPSQRGSPNSTHAKSEGSRLPFDSPQSTERRRRPSGVSVNSDQMIMSPGQSSPSSVSRSLAATSSSYWQSGPRSQRQSSASQHTVTFAETGPVLAPAPEIEPRRKRRSSASHAPPPLLSSTQRKHYSDLGGAPRTPTTAPRSGILRMPSQQAEKDAVDTLLFMSSPNNSSRVAHTSIDSKAHPSPLRSEAARTRRVMFENHSIKDIAGQQHKANIGQSGAFSRANTTR